MRKIKRFMSGLLAVIMLSAVVAPLIEVLPVHAANDTSSYNKFDLKGTILDDFSVGTRALKSDPVSQMSAYYNNEYPGFYMFLHDEEDRQTSSYLQFGGSNASDNDYDGDGWEFVQGLNSSDYQTLTGFTLYTRYLKGMKSQDKNLSGTGLVSLDTLTEELAEELGISAEGIESGELMPIWATAATNKNSEGSTGQFVACDFNPQTMTYVYYYAGAKRDSGRKDDFASMVIVSKQFYAMPSSETWFRSNNNGEAGLNGPSYEVIDDIDCEGGQAATTVDTYITNVASVCQVLSGNGTLFEEIFTTKQITDEQAERIAMINNMLNYGAVYDEIAEISEYKIKANRTYGIMPYYANINDGNTLGLVICNTEYDFDDDEEEVFWRSDFEDFEIDFEISTGFMTFGDLNETTGSSGFPVNETDDDAQNALRHLAGTIINGCATAAGAETCATAEEVLQLLVNENLDSGFVYELLFVYKGKLEEVIEAGAVRQVIENAGVLTVNGEENSFNILNSLLILSTQKAVAGEGLDCVYKTNGGVVIDMQTTTTSDSLRNGCTTSIPLLLADLNDYQKSILSTAYYQKMCALDISKSDASVLTTIYTTGSNGPVGEYSYAALGSGGVPEHATVEYVNDLITDYAESDLVNTGVVTNVARNCNVLTHYVVVSSLYNAQAGTSENTGLYAVYNANLESLIKEQWLYKNTSTSNFQQDYFSYLPQDIPLFGTSAENYTVMCEMDSNWNRFTNLMFNVEYAYSTLAFSDLAVEQGYTPQQLEEWFNGSQTPDQVLTWMNEIADLDAYSSSAISADFNNDEFSVNMLRCVIEIHDMCEFLGIEEGDWSESIDCYLRIYDAHPDFFNALRQNPVIYQQIEQVEQSTTEPLAMFFSLENKSVSDDWAKGFSMSALYVPMETNLYEASSVSFINDGEWTSDFFYKYGFYRKALYISTDNSAVVNKFVSNTSSGTRPATLNDLLNYDRDIILYIDDNFYNADEISDVISSLDYTGMRNTANTDDTATGIDAVGNWISDSLDLSPAEVLKTGPSSYYSETLISHVRKFGESEDDFDITANMVDCYVLSQEDLIGTDNVFNTYEYSPKVSYGVVSSVYRSAELYNETLTSLVTDNAIFKSSKAICNTPGTTSTDWRSIYNYCMLANLEEQMKNDTASTLDLDAPIFCDLFGNIVTESGLVIIPAASNATLCGTNWTPYTIGFAEYYNNGNHINVTEFGDNFNTWILGRTYTTNTEGSAEENTIDTADNAKKENAGGYFDVNTNGDLVLKATSMQSGNLSAVIQWNTLNKNSTVIKQIFFNDAYFGKAAKLYSPVFVNLVIEVMRGAPIEYIDYTFEGLGGNQDISKYGIYMAYKLEELLDAIMPSTNGDTTGGNAVVTMPNLAFMPGVEVVMLYLFKIVFAVLIVALVIQLYLDAVKNHLGFKSVGKFIVTCMMVIVAFTVVPTLITWSYYNANKTLLKDEVGEIAMLNYVKEFDGAEIGITSVRTPETQTDLYIKLDDVALEWWTIIGDVLFGNTYKSVSELYEEQSTNHPYANYSNIITKGSGMYISVQDVFDSTDINYRPTSGIITNTMYTYAQSSDGVISTNAPLSYTMPYYVFLDQMIANVNEYNNARDITAYSWTIGSNGHIMTYDVVTPYFTSSEFLDEGMDILGLDRIVNTGTQRPLYNFAFEGGVVNLDVYGNETTDPSKVARTILTGDVDRMSRSLWYPHEDMPLEERQRRVDELYAFARDYIADNQDILGKVPDEVFLKVMAMQLSIEYNRIFDVSYGNSIEIMNVDTRDLMRFMVAENDQVYKYYSYSFARFTYEQSGGLGVIFSALLMVVLWLTGFIKPLFMIIILGLLITNCVFRKVLFRKDSRCIEGYLIGCACLVMTNYAYAGMLKVTMLIANLGLGSILSLVVGFVVQVIYVGLLCLIMYIEIKDWRNSGFNEFVAIGSNITSGMLKAQNVVVDKLMSKTSQSYRDSANSRRYVSDNYTRETLDQMHERDAEREENGTYSIT